MIIEVKLIKARSIHSSALSWNVDKAHLKQRLTTSRNPAKFRPVRTVIRRHFFPCKNRHNQIWYSPSTITRTCKKATIVCVLRYIANPPTSSKTKNHHAVDSDSAYAPFPIGSLRHIGPDSRPLGIRECDEDGACFWPSISIRGSGMLLWASSTPSWRCFVCGIWINVFI